MSRPAHVVAAGALLSVLFAAPASAATLPAIDESRGSPGYCPDDDGVTVVVDFGDLGDDVIVRCAPGDEDRNGLEALQDAGFDIEGVQRYGASVACRIEGRPAPDESLDVAGQDGYREACVDMPPASAYWSYWSADDGGDWAYSQWGLKSRDAIEGGFEGWSYSLNGTAATRTAPRIDPVRPDADSGSQGAPGDGSDPDAGSGGDGRGRTDADGSTGTDGEALPMPKKREASPPPTEGTRDGVHWSGGEDASAHDVAAGDDGDSGSPAPTIAAAGVAGVLGVLIVVTAARRRSRRSG